VVSTPKQYADRTGAGRTLAERLSGYAKVHPVVVGLPRGGVVVAVEVARALGAELDVIIAGKLRAPGNPELAIGAITEDGLEYLNKAVFETLRITREYIEDEKLKRLEMVRARLKEYRSVRAKVELKDRTVILVDDGLATGSTMIAAVHAAAASKAGKIIVAVPGGPVDTLERISAMEEVSRVVCPLVPPIFYAVSQLYMNFAQVEDREVMELLKGSSSPLKGSAP
jgi:predicted phosphoribosyltransferase